MDQVETLDRYRALIQQTLEGYVRMDAEPETSEMLAVCDRASDNYLLLDVGWDATGRVHYVIAHLRLKKGKVLIEKDGIEYGIAQDLQEAGIPAEDIVTAWRRSPQIVGADAVAA
jgi:hypothetical protein